MKYRHRNNTDEDLLLIIECRRQSTTRENCADYPTVSDLYKLLDPSAQTYVALWENIEKQVVAFAITHLPYCNLYFFILPEIQDYDLEAAIIHWGVERIRLFGREQNKPVTLDTACRDTDTPRLAMLARHGFIELGDQTLHMECSLREPLSAFQMPAGFTLRNVAGKHEVEEYVAIHREAFGTYNMTVEQRLGIMNNADYRPQLDLLAVASDGSFAAFCFCSINAESNAQCGRNEGEIAAVGTRPQFRQRGLGRAMTLAGMQRLQEHGMEVAWLTTGSWNVNAHRVFESAGFRTTYRILWFSRGV